MTDLELFKGFSYVKDCYLAQAEAPAKKRSLKKTLTVALAAAISVSILGIAAVAQDWVPGIFGTIAERNPEEAALYETAEVENLGKPVETVELPKLNLKDAKLLVKQKYYDGQNILLGIDLREAIEAPTVGYRPDEDLLRLIRSRSYNKFDAFMAQSERHEFHLENVSLDAAQTELPRYAGRMDLLLRQILSPEDYAVLQTQLQTEGYGCVAFHDVIIGDHILVNGVDQGYINDKEILPDLGIRTDDTDAGMGLRLQSLPQTARDQDSVTVELKVKSYYEFWYLEADGHAYCDIEPAQEQVVPVVIENTGK